MISNKKISTYVIIALFVLFVSVGQVNAADYENYFGVEMTNEEYNTLLNLGFTEDEIYYMDNSTYLENRDLDANLVSQNSKYYKTTYTDLAGNPTSVEITEDEYNNQPSISARGSVTTEYKHMVSTLSQNGSKYRYKVSLSWRSLPSTRSYDIIGVGFDTDNVYISSGVYFSFHYCYSSGSCTNDSTYYNKKETSLGAAAVYKLPTSVVSLSSTLYYDVAKSTSSTVTYQEMCGDYSHATSNVSVSNISDYDISYLGIELGSSLVGDYDAIPCAISTWSGSW